MLLRCPNCGITSERFVVSGTLMIGSTEIQFDDQGAVQIMAPIVTRFVIKNGHELDDSDRLRLKCPSCQQQAEKTAFVPLVRSAYSGVEGATQSMRIGIKNFFFSEEEESILQAAVRANASYAPEVSWEQLSHDFV